MAQDDVSDGTSQASTDTLASARHRKDEARIGCPALTRASDLPRRRDPWRRRTVSRANTSVRPADGNPRGAKQHRDKLVPPKKNHTATNGARKGGTLVLDAETRALLGGASDERAAVHARDLGMRSEKRRARHDETRLPRGHTRAADDWPVRTPKPSGDAPTARRTSLAGRPRRLAGRVKFRGSEWSSQAEQWNDSGWFGRGGKASPMREDGALGIVDVVCGQAARGGSRARERAVRILVTVGGSVTTARRERRPPQRTQTLRSTSKVRLSNVAQSILAEAA